MPLRSPRLEGIFGVPVDALTAEHIQTLVRDRVAEAFDLDYKLTLYGTSDANKRELAGDVAALANTAGGVILLGVNEDDQARAIDAPGVLLSDDEQRRMGAIIAAGVAPVPNFDIYPIRTDEAEAGSATGCYAIAVQRTTAAPHAVIVNTGFRYPRRNGADTRYLSEPEVAEAYRSRLAGLGAQTSRLDDLWHAGVTQLDTEEEAWVAVALVPEVLGSFRVDQASRRGWDHEARQRHPTVVDMSFMTYRTFVGRGYLGADGTSRGALSRWFRTELHSDGSGFFATAAGWQRRGPTGEPLEPASYVLDDEHLSVAVLSALVRLPEHALRAAASGMAALRVGIVGLRVEAPGSLGHSRGGFGRDTYNDVQLGIDPAPVDTAVDLDAVSMKGPELIAAAGEICTRLGQSFGVAEMGQFSEDGRIRRPYISHALRPRLEAWAGKEVEVVDEQLPF